MSATFVDKTGMTREQLRVEVDRRRRRQLTEREQTLSDELYRLGQEFIRETLDRKGGWHG